MKIEFTRIHLLLPCAFVLLYSLSRHVLKAMLVFWHTQLTLPVNQVNSEVNNMSIHNNSNKDYWIIMSCHIEKCLLLLLAVYLCLLLLSELLHSIVDVISYIIFVILYIPTYSCLYVNPTFIPDNQARLAEHSLFHSPI